MHPRNPIKKFPASPFFSAAVLLALAMILRACFAGISYEPILDDSIQYISYANADPILLIREEGLFASRPLAAVIDLFLIAPMHRFLLLPVLLISALHGIAAVIFQNLFGKHFSTGILFSVVYALLPLGVEGTYWLSASSRIVVGLFFTALAAHYFDRFLESGTWRTAAAFLLFQGVSFFLYEQVLVTSFTLTALLFLCHRREKRAHIAWASFLNLAVYFAFTAAHKGEGALSQRMQILLPTAAYWWDTFLPNVVGQVRDVFVTGGIRTLGIGFARGITLAAENAGGILYLILSAAAAVILFFITKPQKGRNVVPLTGAGGALLIGILLTLAPVSIFFVIEPPYFPVRAAVCSFIGIGILADLLTRALVRSGKIYRAVTAVLVFVFLVAGASEVYDYKSAAAADTALAREILAHEAEMSGNVGILGAEKYAKEQSFPHQEHVIQAASAAWSLQGRVVAMKGEELTVTLIPLTVTGNELYRDWNRDEKRLTNLREVWLWENGTLSPLAVHQVGENDFDLYRMGGTLYKKIRERNGIGYVE